MTDAVLSFQKIFDKKRIEYRSLYYESLRKTIIGSGVKIYNNDIISSPLVRGVKSLELWRE